MIVAFETFQNATSTSFTALTLSMFTCSAIEDVECNLLQCTEVSLHALSNKSRTAVAFDFLACMQQSDDDMGRLAQQDKEASLSFVLC